MTTVLNTRAIDVPELRDNDLTHWRLHKWEYEDDHDGARFNVDGALTAQRLIADYRIAPVVNAMLATSSWCREPGGDWAPCDDTHITVGTRVITVAVSSPAEGDAVGGGDNSDAIGCARLQQLEACCAHIDAAVERARSIVALL